MARARNSITCRMPTTAYLYGNMTLTKRPRYEATSQRSGFIRNYPDGKNIFLMGRSLYKYGSSPKAIKFTADKTLDPAAERAFMFDFVEREERERFYTKRYAWC